MFILSIGTSLFEVLPLWTASPIISKIARFFRSFVDSCIGTICHHKDFTGRVLLWEIFISRRNNLFHTQKRFFSGKLQIPKWAPFAPNGTANQIAGNPGTAVVSIGHLIPWPENPGYRTQVWDKICHASAYWQCQVATKRTEISEGSSTDTSFTVCVNASIAWCKTVVTQVHQHRSYHSH